jgi:phage repressor protein C with HTH and peptisase S24 domain
MLKDRLRRCAALAGSGDALARKTGIPRRTLETYLSGHAEPKASRLATITETVGVSGHWLLTGEGGEEPPPPVSLSADRFEMIPVVGTVESGPAGRPAGSPDSEDHLVFCRDWLERRGLDKDTLVVIESHGDSMYPTITDGAALLVDTSDQEVRQEGIYALFANGTLVTRRVQIDLEDGLIVKSDNAAYQEQYLPPDKRGQLTVYGRVVWVGNLLA